MISPDGTLISASAAPHCRVAKNTGLQSRQTQNRSHAAWKVQKQRRQAHNLAQVGQTEILGVYYKSDQTAYQIEENWTSEIKKKKKKKKERKHNGHDEIFALWKDTHHKKNLPNDAVHLHYAIDRVTRQYIKQ